MNRVMLTILAALLVLVYTGTAAAAATAPPALTADQAEEITKIYQEITDLKKKIVDRCVEYGQLPADQAELFKSRLDLRQKMIDQNPRLFCPFQPEGRKGRKF